MAIDPLQNLRLKLMNDALPLGLGVVSRWRDRGTQDLLSQLRQGKTGIEALQRDGEDDARKFRDALDQVAPGLGNPVVKVSVSEVSPKEASASSTNDLQELQDRLLLITDRIAKLKSALPMPTVEDSAT